MVWQRPVSLVRFPRRRLPSPAFSLFPFLSLSLLPLSGKKLHLLASIPSLMIPWTIIDGLNGALVKAHWPR